MENKNSKSSSITGQLLNLTFEDIAQSGRFGLLKREKRQLLKNVSGDFRPGELTALIGSSGAGKSTLMDILSGFIRAESGVVSVNNRPRDEAAFRRSSSYIMQSDNLEQLLTINESMKVAADLKLTLSAKEKNQRISQIIDAMGLSYCQDTRASDLSGGERKRLAISLELVNNPPVMFFDEPTSGLDCVAAKHCINLLRALAKEGPRTIIITIHQPSAAIFNIIDHVYFLNNGNCVYTGGSKLLEKFLVFAGIPCPEYHNLADFLLEICDGVHGDHSESLVNLIENGKCNNWRSVSDIESSTSRHNGFSLQLPEIYSAEMCKKNPQHYATSCLKQFGILFRMSVVKLLRDKVLTSMRLSVHCAIALLVGTLYWRIGNKASHALNNMSFLFYNVMFLMYTAFSSMIITYPLAMPVIMRQHFNRWYKLRPFYLANKFADLPVQIFSVLLYIIIVYLMTGQIFNSQRFVLLFIAYVAITLIAQMIGVIVGTALSIQYGVIFGPLFIMPFVVFSGFFVHLNAVPPFLHWLFHISFIKHGFESVMISIYGFDRPKLDCSETLYCRFAHPKEFLSEIDMKNAEYWPSLLFLICLYFALDFVAYITLSLRVKKII